MRSSVLAVVASLAFACVPVQKLPLSSPAEGRADAVQAQATSVSANGAFLAQRGSGPSVLAASLSLANDGVETALIELERAVLVFADPAGELPETIIPATVSGMGETPEAIPPGRAVSLALHAGESTRVWIAFRRDEPLVRPDLPRRIVLRVPVMNASRSVEIILAEPATGRPRWEHPPIDHASYAGVSVLGTPFEEGSFAILRTSSKSHVRRVILGPTVYLGARAGELRGEREPTIVCCDLGVSFDVNIPIWQGHDNSFGPWLSYQSIFALERGRIDKAMWHGPGIGLAFHTRLLEPIVASGLPVRPTASPLGYSSFTIAYVHLFRRGDDGGSPAMLLAFERTLPEW